MAPRAAATHAGKQRNQCAGGTSGYLLAVGDALLRRGMCNNSSSYSTDAFSLKRALLAAMSQQLWCLANTFHTTRDDWLALTYSSVETDAAGRRPDETLPDVCAACRARKGKAAEKLCARAAAGDTTVLSAEERDGRSPTARAGGGGTLAYEYT